MNPHHQHQPEPPAVEGTPTTGATPAPGASDPRALSTQLGEGLAQLGPLERAALVEAGQDFGTSGTTGNLWEALGDAAYLVEDLERRRLVNAWRGEPIPDEVLSELLSARCWTLANRLLNAEPLVSRVFLSEFRRSRFFGTLTALVDLGEDR